MDTTPPSEAHAPGLPPQARSRLDLDGTYRPLLQHFLEECALDQGEAEDVIRQSIAAITHHLQRSNREPVPEHFKAWLRDVVTNRVHNVLRSLPDYAHDPRSPQQRDSALHALFDQAWIEQAPEAQPAGPAGPAGLASPSQGKSASAHSIARQAVTPETSSRAPSSPTPAKSAISASPGAARNATMAPESFDRQHNRAVQADLARAALQLSRRHTVDSFRLGAETDAVWPARRATCGTTKVTAAAPSPPRRASWIPGVVLGGLALGVAASAVGLAQGLRRQDTQLAQLQTDKAVAMGTAARAQRTIELLQDVADRSDARVEELTRSGQVDEAVVLCGHTLALRSALAGEDDSPPSDAAAYRKIGDVLTQHGRVADALQSHLRALDIALESCQTAPDAVAPRADLAVAYDRVAVCLQALGYAGDALTYWRAAAETDEQLLAAEPGAGGPRHRLAQVCGRAGAMLVGLAEAEARDPVAQRQLLEEAQEWLERARSSFLELRGQGLLATTDFEALERITAELGHCHEATTTPP